MSQELSGYIAQLEQGITLPGDAKNGEKGTFSTIANMITSLDGLKERNYFQGTREEWQTLYGLLSDKLSVVGKAAEIESERIAVFKQALESANTWYLKNLPPRIRE